MLIQREDGQKKLKKKGVGRLLIVYRWFDGLMKEFGHELS